MGKGTAFQSPREHRGPKGQDKGEETSHMPEFSNTQFLEPNTTWAHRNEFSRVGGGLNVCPRLLHTEGVLRKLFGSGATNDSSPLSASWVLRPCTCPVDLGARSLISQGALPWSRVTGALLCLPLTLFF